MTALGLWAMSPALQSVSFVSFCFEHWVVSSNESAKVALKSLPLQTARAAARRKSQSCDFRGFSEPPSPWAQLHSGEQPRIGAAGTVGRAHGREAAHRLYSGPLAQLWAEVRALVWEGEPLQPGARTLRLELAPHLPATHFK